MTIPPCTGRWLLFDSVTRDAHRVARGLCAACPFINACAAELDAARRAAYPGYGPRGTWAGRLVGVAKTDERTRMAREDAAFTQEEARRAHAAYNRGQRSSWAETGQAVYERRRGTKRRRRKGAAA